MKKWKKAIIIVVAFFTLYGLIMIVGYDHFYGYPKGKLDTIEREDEAYFYALVRKVKLNSKTTLYFTKSNNGVGYQAHVGTLKSNMPDIIANFFCKSTSSYYIPVNKISYGVTTDGICYLFGTTSDENTVAVQIVFERSSEDKVTLDMDYSNKCYYYLNFDQSLADYPCHIYGLNSDGGITFQYQGTAFTAGQSMPE